MDNSVKEKITTDLKQAKEVGQLRADRIREIMRSAIDQIASEFKAGTGDLRSLVKDAFSSAAASLQESGAHVKEDITASVEGVIEGISRARQQRIAETESEVKRLQDQLTEQEDELEQEVEAGMDGLKDAAKEMSAEVREQIEAAIDSIRNSEEAALLKKRYAQVQAQLAILRANLAARTEDYHDRAQAHLDEAKQWYDQARPNAETVKDQADQKMAELDQKIGEAGVALAQRERQVRRLLKDLLKQATDMVRDAGEARSKTAARTGEATKLPPSQIEIEDSKTR